MKKLCALIISALLLLSFTPVSAYEDTYINVLINGQSVSFPSSPFIRDGVTYIDAQTLASTLNLEYKTFPDHNSITISNRRTSVCFVPGEPLATVADLTGQSDKEYHFITLTGPCLYADGRYIIAARDLANTFGYSLGFNSETLTVYFGYAPQMISENTRHSIESKAYYSQNQPEFNLPSGGSGYCWVCSYAMVLSNLTGTRITPNDVSAVNLNFSSSGAYCYHHEIVSAFNVKFVSALSLQSPYYGGRDSTSGGTFIHNPENNDAVVRNAIKEALLLHPEGVLVRYSDFPHTIVAVAEENGIILFNDPVQVSGNRNYRGVPFSETCIGKKGFVLSDVTFIQAID